MGEFNVSISWYNFTHPNKEAIQKRDKLLEEPVKDCTDCSHFYFNNDGSAGCDSPYELYCLKNNFFNFISKKVEEEYLKTVEEEIQHYGEIKNIK